MAEDNPDSTKIDAEAFSMLSRHEQSWLRRRRLWQAEWAAKDLPVGPIVFGMRARARSSQTRATIFLCALIFTVLVGVVYFVAYPIYFQSQTRIEDAERRTQLAQIGAEEVRLAGQFDQLKVEAVTAALSVWEAGLKPRDLNDVAFAGPLRGWAVGDDGVIIATIDGGANWTLQREPDGRDLHAVAFVDTQLGWAVGEGAVIVSTTNGGDTWTIQNDESGVWRSSASLYDVFFINSERGWAVGYTNLQSAMYFTENGGLLWDPVRIDDDDFPITFNSLSSITFIDSQLGWAVGGEGQTVSTTDGGETWQTISWGWDNARLNAVSFVDAVTGWATSSEGLFTTRDGGRTWISVDEAGTYDVAFVDAYRGWVLRSFELGSMGNGGAAWEYQEAARRPPPSDGSLQLVPRNISDRAIGTMNSMALWDSQPGWVVGNSGLILSSSDGGETWQQQQYPAPLEPTVETDWFGAAVQQAETAQDLQRAVTQSKRSFADTEFLNRLSTHLGEQAGLAERKTALPGATLTLEDQALDTARDAVARAATEEERQRALALFDAALRQKAFAQTWWQRLDEQIPLGVLLLFLLATFGSLYRYNTRIAGFYHARADALELMALENPPDQKRFEALAGMLAADRVELKAAKTPADMATEITKEVIAKLDLKRRG